MVLRTKYYISQHIANSYHIQHIIFTQLVAVCYREMALLRYLIGVPNLRGVLSLSLTSQAIAEANREVQEATSCSSKKWVPSPVAASQISW